MNGYPYLDDLALQARDRPEAPALVLADRTLTWRELDLAAEAYAPRHSWEDGSGPRGQAVGLLLPPGEEAVAALHALPRIGSPLMPLDPRLSGGEADDTFERFGLRRMQEASDYPKSTGDAAWVDPSPDSIRTSMLTSGSSGEPRRVPLTFANHRAAAEAARQLLDLTPEDRWLACLPFHHIGGLSVFTRSAHVGFAAVVVWPFDAAGVIDAVERHQATAISLVPTMLRRLLDAGWASPTSLRFVLLGGGACPPSLLREALDRGVPIAPTYGMTETCSQICTLPPDEVSTHVGTVGRPIPGAAVSVRDGSGAPRPNGEAGRIWVKGAMVADPDWMETGDVGVLDQGGYLTVIGRADEIIVTGGEKVAPAEIEELLVMRDDVAEAAVVGVADPEWGERVVAAVVLAVVPGREGTPDAEALRSYLRENLAPFKVPRSITVVDELPLIGPGKVDRNMLRELTSVAQQEARDL